MSVEKLAGFDSRQKLPDGNRRPIQRVHQSRNRSARVRVRQRSHEAGVNIYLIRRDEHKNRCAAVVPESAMKAPNLRNVNSFLLP